MASLGVFVVALPLSLGIALCSGVPIQSAIISAVIGGIVVGALSGAPLTVTGPAAGLSVIVFEIVREQGLKGLAVATIACGLLQIIFGALKLGHLFKKVPHAILDGMLAAIGAMIALSQVFVMLNTNVPKGFLASLASLPSAMLSVLDLQNSQSRAMTGLMIGIATIGVQLSWETLAKRVSRIPKAIPGALVALTIVTISAIPFETPRVDLHISMNSLLSGFELPNLGSGNAMKDALMAAIILAVVGSVESLATASGLDLYAEKMKGIILKTELNKELFAQGMGNLVAGLFGGIPLTAVIVRSAANVQFGARSRVSTILHGVWILLAVMVLGGILRFIPLASLAAVLIVTGIRLVNVKVLMEHMHKETAQGIAYLVTFATILASNLLRGLICGILFAGAHWVYQRQTDRSRALARG